MEKGNFFSFFKYWKIASKEYKHLVTGLLLFALFNSSDVFLLLKTKETIGANTIKIFGNSFDGDTISIAAFVFYNLIWSLGSFPSGILVDKIGYKRFSFRISFVCNCLH